MEPTVDPALFRRAFGLFATGVTVVSASSGTAVHGMTANAVASLSLDPLLILVALDRRARMNQFIRDAGGFAMNVLRDDQEALSRFFSGGWKHRLPPEFRFEPWEGVPRLVGSLASFACRLDQVLEGGDHWIITGRVTSLHEGLPPYRPLLFFSGRYRRLAEVEVPPTAPIEELGHEAINIYYSEWSER